MKTEYRILLASTTESLEEIVNELLKDGWELQGGVSSSSHAYEYDGRDGHTIVEDYTFIQAMVLKTL